MIKVPQYGGLKVKDLIRFARSKLDIHKFLPEYSYHKEPSRDWIYYIINSLISKEFKEFIKEKTDNHNKELIKVQNI